MRITTRMMTSRYSKNLGNLASGLDKLNYQISSGRKFSRVSENTSAAISAFQIRRDLSKLEGYQSNIEYAQDTLSNAESALMNINGMMQAADSRILQGINATMTTSDKTIVAKELREMQAQLVQSLNATSMGSYCFGGTETQNKPFEIVSGTLQYNGKILNDINDTTIYPAGTEAKLKTDAMYLDIGLNLGFNPTVSQTVDPSTALNIALPGLNIVGSGTTPSSLSPPNDNIPNNLYDLLGRIATELESSSGSAVTLNTLFGHFQKQSANIMMTVTEIGSKSNYLEFMSKRMDNEVSNLKIRQANVEYADPTATIIDFKSQEMAYNAALQMGQKIIQPSIFDFMR